MGQPTANIKNAVKVGEIYGRNQKMEEL